MVTATNLEPRTFPLPERAVPVVIDRLDDDLATLSSYLREHLAGEFDVTINHARFLACDRAVKDRKLLSRVRARAPCG